MKGAYTFIRSQEWLTMTVAVVAGVLLVVGFVNASTTISTSISTGGTLTVTGGPAVIAGGTYASSTLQGTNITSYGTLGVTGATTLSATTTLASSLILHKTTAGGTSCIEFYATSTATTVTLTFYATSTLGASNVGMLVYGYGACN